MRKSIFNYHMCVKSIRRYFECWNFFTRPPDGTRSKSRNFSFREVLIFVRRLIRIEAVRSISNTKTKKETRENQTLNRSQKTLRGSPLSVWLPGGNMLITSANGFRVSGSRSSDIGNGQKHNTRPEFL